MITFAVDRWFAKNPFFFDFSMVDWEAGEKGFGVIDDTSVRSTNYDNLAFGYQMILQGTGFEIEAGIPTAGTVTSISYELIGNGTGLAELTGIDWDLPTLRSEGIKSFLKGEDIVIDASIDLRQKFFLTLGEDFNVFNGLSADITILGSPGEDNLRFDDFRYKGGARIIDAAGGDDMVFGGASKDLLRGGSGDDYIAGGSGKDKMYGGDGADTLDAGAGRDRMFGGAGNDVLEGGRGADRMVGGAGSDTLVGDVGRDLLTGGTGSDSFVIRLNSGPDTVTDFEAGRGGDLLVLDEALVGGSKLRDFLKAAQDTEEGALFTSTAGDGTSLLLLDVTLDDLVPANIDIV